MNSVTRKDVYPLPNIEECLDTLAGNIWFSKLDANSAYWQIRVDKEDQGKTAFITRYGLYEFERMGFGLCNAPATFSRAMNFILRGLTWEVALAFLDDVLVLGKNFEEHSHNLRLVLDRFQLYGLKLKPRKCALFQTNVEFLGRDVDSTGLHLKTEQIQAIQSWPVPESTREVERFLGLVNYHRIFLRNYAKVAAPLYSLTGKHAFKWEDVHQHAFEAIKHMLTEAPVLTLPNATDMFILDTDASDIALGAELLQIQEGEEKVVAYGSCGLAKEQRRYCVTRKKLLAVVMFTRLYRHYLLGKPFLIRTDHSSLRWLLNLKRPEGQIARWLEEVSQYDFHIEHRKGYRHVNADALSRIPQQGSTCSCYQLGSRLEDLPCGGCHHCERAHKRWACFAEEVDNVVSLSKRPEVPTESSAEQGNECITQSNELPEVPTESSAEQGNECITQGNELPEVPTESSAEQGDEFITQGKEFPPGAIQQLRVIVEQPEFRISAVNAIVTIPDESDNDFRDAQEKDAYLYPFEFGWILNKPRPKQISCFGGLNRSSFVLTGVFSF